MINPSNSAILKSGKKIRTHYCLSHTFQCSSIHVKHGTLTDSQSKHLLRHVMVYAILIEMLLLLLLGLTTVDIQGLAIPSSVSQVN